MPEDLMDKLKESIGPDSPVSWWPRETACIVCGAHASAFYRGSTYCVAHLHAVLEG